MPRKNIPQLEARLTELQQQLRAELCRLLRDIDYWFLPTEFDDKRAYFRSFHVDRHGRLVVTCDLLASVKAYDCQLDALAPAGESFEKARELAKEMRRVLDDLEQVRQTQSSPR